SVPVGIADLPDGPAGQPPTLGYTAGTVLIDINAGGFGWFIDPTPADDAEFAARNGPEGLKATADSPAFGRMDLLTVVMRELGRMRGREDESQAGAAADLMFETLAPGVRRLPDAFLGAPAPGKGVPGSSPLADTAGSGPASSQQAIIDAAFASLAP